MSQYSTPWDKDQPALSDSHAGVKTQGSCAINFSPDRINACPFEKLMSVATGHVMRSAVCVLVCLCGRIKQQIQFDWNSCKFLCAKLKQFRATVCSYVVGSGCLEWTVTAIGESASALSQVWILRHAWRTVKAFRPKVAIFLMCSLNSKVFLWLTLTQWQMLHWKGWDTSCCANVVASTIPKQHQGGCDNLLCLQQGNASSGPGITKSSMPTRHWLRGHEVQWVALQIDLLWRSHLLHSQLKASDWAECLSPRISTSVSWLWGPIYLPIKRQSNHINYELLGLSHERQRSLPITLHDH